MISLDLARRLHEAGLEWTPAEGDRFVLPDRDLDGRVFTISEMVVEVRRSPVGSLIAFNGTTEWALDSIEQATAIWLPRESQLREALGDAMLSLARVDEGGASRSGWAVRSSSAPPRTPTTRTDSPCSRRCSRADRAARRTPRATDRPGGSGSEARGLVVGAPHRLQRLGDLADGRLRPHRVHDQRHEVLVRGGRGREPREGRLQGVPVA
jgi:hypothetical protein